jgi:hypothetical protein
VSDFNPVLQFRAEEMVKRDEYAFALAGGAWLTCIHPAIIRDGLLVKGAVLFRDYWRLYCYDDGCAAAKELRELL